MARLSTLARPFIVGVVTERTPNEALTSIEAAAAEGADAIEVNLSAIGEVSNEEFRVLAGGGVPVYTSCRRPAFLAVYGIDPRSCPAWDEDGRMARQLQALSAGSVALDMELDTFDPHPSPPFGSRESTELAVTVGEPMEVSHADSAVARQRDVVARARDLGGEVIMSCHTGRRQTAQQLIGIVGIAVERGADLVKIVSPCANESDLDELRDAQTRLRESGVPFALIGAGAAGSESRTLRSPNPSAWAIGRPAVQTHSFHGQPLISQLWVERNARSAG